MNELRLSAQEEHLTAVVELGRYDQAATELSALADAHPLRERLRELHMLALYGGGRQAEALEAFSRTRLMLQEELGVDPGPGLRTMHERILAMDPTLLNPAPAPPASSPVPPTPTQPDTPVPAQLPADVAHFTGRVEECKALTALAGQVAGTVVVSAIGGTAGIGKTALAVHWAHRNAALFPDGALYVNLRGFDPVGSPVSAGTAIRGFLDALGQPSARIPVGIEAQAGLYRSLLSGKRVIIVLDNAREADQVRPLLPGAPGCLVLVTSRDQLAGLIALDGAHSLTLELLTPAEARALLTRRLGTARVEAESDAVDELIELCARLPLALNITAARAATRPRFPLAAFATELREAHHRLTALDVGDPTANVRAVFSWSYQTLTEPAARMFRVLGIHPGPDITMPAAASLAALDHDQTRAALNELTRAHLLTEHAPGRYAFHDLLRAYATEQTQTLDTGAERERALRRALDHYMHSACHAARTFNPSFVDPSLTGLPEPEVGVTPETPADDKEAWDWFTAEHQVALNAITQAAAHHLDTHVCRLADAVSNYLSRRGHPQDYLTTQTAALAAADRLGDVTAQARAHRYLAEAHYSAENYARALIHLESVAELSRRLGDPVGQARAQTMMGAVLNKLGRHREAIEEVGQALSEFGAAVGDFGQAVMLNSIGWAYAQLGEHQQSLSYCEEALDRCREEQKSDHGRSTEFVEAAIRSSLGHTHHQLGHHRHAVENYRHALDLFRKAGERYELAGVLSGLGDTYLSLGDRDAARDAWEQAESILDDLQHSEAEDVRRKIKAIG